MPCRLILALVAFLAVPVGSAQAFDTAATAAWVFDATTQTVLLDKNAHQPLPPASMSKLMTLNMLFEALADGRVAMDTTFAVSTKARRMGGSTMFLNEQDRPTARDLIRGIIINSGNDACVVVAEGLAGTEDAFAAQMTERARALGMTQSVFANASGWPDPNHRMSLHDLGIIARRLIDAFPQEYAIFKETEFNFADRSEANRFNRNPLLGLGIGADGLKTGHTTEAGYGMVGSAVQGDRRVIFVITGLDSDTARAEEAERIVTWAFRDFVVKTVARADLRLADAPVWMGAEATVGLVPARDVTLLLPAQGQDGISAEVSYDGPLAAPLSAGQSVAELVVRAAGLPDVRVPLVAETAVPRAGFFRRLATAAGVLWGRAWPDAPAS